MTEEVKRNATVICWRCHKRLSPKARRCLRCYPEPPPKTDGPDGPEGEWVERYLDGAVDE